MSRRYPSTYLIDKLLPIDEVNYISGGSGANKTSLIAYIIPKWSRGEPVFGFESYPTPWVYFSLDRSSSETEERLISCGLDVSEADFYSFDDTENLNLDLIKTRIRPDHKLVIIENIVALLRKEESANSSNDVSRFIRKLKRWIREDHRSLLFTSWDAKGRTSEGGFANARERIGGSVAWGGNSSTVFNMTRVDETHRTLDVAPRGSQEFTRHFILGTKGELIEGANPEDANRIGFTMWLLSTPVGYEMDLNAIEVTAELYQLSERTWRRAIAELVEAGSYRRISANGAPGRYVRQANPTA